MVNNIQEHGLRLNITRNRRPTATSKSKQKSKVAAYIILVIVCKSASGFSPRQTLVRPNRRSTAFCFHYNGDGNIGNASSEPDMAAAWKLVNAPISPAENRMDKKDKRVPIWLQNPEGTFAEIKLQTFRDSMKDSSLASYEATIVETAIREAARGDSDKIAGAADFCQIMLDTMDIGVSALVAASFHYCSCYSSALSNRDECPELKSLSTEALSIFKDAAQLKQIENDYASIDKLNSGNLRMLILARTNNWNALAIRSAASLYRLRGILRNCIETRREKIGATEKLAARQAIHIYAPLASQLGMYCLKNKIESAAFQILYSRQFTAFNNMMSRPKKIVPGYHPVSSQNNQFESFTCLKDDLDRILAHSADEVSRHLSEDPLLSKYINDMTITTRVKEPYSLWKKALKLGAKSIIDVPDALALRIVINGKKIESETDEVTEARDRVLCYCAHQICSKHFKPLEGSKFKNYIAHPKPNGYQSLHYTTRTEYKNEKYPLEIQIRSRKMHQVAEFGLAAHWSYKYQTKKFRTNSKVAGFTFDHSTAAYLSACSELQWQHVQNNSKSWMTDPSRPSNSGPIDSSVNKVEKHNDPFITALELAQSELARQRVYIFLASQQPSQKDGNLSRNGKLLELPAGACVLDALRESERSLGFSTSLRDQSLAGIMLNDEALTSLTHKLQNGDILSIPTNAQRLDDGIIMKPVVSSSMRIEASNFQ